MIAAVIFSVLIGLQPEVPDSLTLEYCYDRIENHYPLAQKAKLQNKITELNQRIAGRAAYPQVDVGATATYQSEVTDLPFPSGGQFSPPNLSKDQYKVTMDVSQTIYNGEAVSIRKRLEGIKGIQEKQSIEIQLHDLKEQLNQVYFGILLAQKQLQTVETLSESLRSQIEEVKSKVRNGVLLPSQQYILEAELIKTKQDSSEIQANIQSGYKVLGQLIGQEITTSTKLTSPSHDVQFSKSFEELRPEFQLFETNRRALDLQQELAQSQKTPSLSAFGTVAYGRPGFNVFENDLHPYYIVGLKVQWNLWGAQNAGTQQQIYDLQQQEISQEERAFERQLKGLLGKVQERIESLQDQITRDQEIIDLRNKVVSEKSSQLKNGTVTATEYVTELHKATQARLAMLLRKTNLAQAQTEYNIILGRTNNGNK